MKTALAVLLLLSLASPCVASNPTAIAAQRNELRYGVPIQAANGIVNFRPLVRPFPQRLVFIPMGIPQLPSRFKQVVQALADEPAQLAFELFAPNLSHGLSRRKRELPVVGHCLLRLVGACTLPP